MTGKTALVLVDHGSTVAQANALLSTVAAGIAAKRPDLIVRTAHMELAPPTVADAIAECAAAGATEIVVHPYMLAPGRHATQDVPRMVAQASAAHPGIRVRVTAPLGVSEKLFDAVLERAAL